MSLLDQLLNQTNILIEILDDTINLITCLIEKQPTQKEISYLEQNINKTADLVKSYIKNYDDFLKYHTDCSNFDNEFIRYNLPVEDFA